MKFDIDVQAVVFYPLGNPSKEKDIANLKLGTIEMKDKVKESKNKADDMIV